MCDQDDLGAFARRISRRTFGAMTLSAGVMAALPYRVDAADVNGASVSIKTADGEADAFFAHPRSGTHPAVLMWPDAFSLRPAFEQMATRLAASGYAVLVVNPFYRAIKAPVVPPHSDFNDPAIRRKLMDLMQSLTPATAVTDATAFVNFLDHQQAVDTRRKLGTMGYCMGGALVFRTAAAMPHRVGACATFHGGALVTDKPDSPHRLIPKMKASFLIAIAESDDQKEPQTKNVLRESFAQANLPAEIEVYAGTQHGWCPTDSPVYDHDAAEKAWGRCIALFQRSLA